MKSVKCSECGFVGWADAERCKKCGVVRLPNSDGDSYQAAPAYEGYQPSYHGNSNRELKKGMAVASLVFGILSLFTLGILGVGAITGIVLAVVALSKAKRNPYEYGGQSLATAGLVTSIISVVMIVPVGIVAAIAIPNLLASRRAANEGSSIAVLRKIHAAEATYQAANGNGAYGTIDQLLTYRLITPDLANNHHGYKFNVEVRPSEYDQPATFQAVGVPITYGDTGIRSFYIDETGVIRAGDDRGANATERDAALNEDSYSSRSPSRRYNSGPPDQY
jgi:type II secretory pathway pseudopilin PulG